MNSNPLTKELKESLWHQYPELPDENRLIFVYTQRGDDFEHDIAHYKSVGKNSKFMYMDDIFLPDMIEALHRHEKALDEEFS
jgi:hypothetical protein